MVAIDGWLVAEPDGACSGSVPPPGATEASPAPCQRRSYLTDTAFQPLQADGSVSAPTVALSLRDNSYDVWAARPSVDVGGARAPQRATYLLQAPPGGICLGPRCPDAYGMSRSWRIIERLDPINVLVGPAPAEDSLGPSDQPIPAPDGDTWTVTQLLDRPTGNGTFVVRAWLVATPLLRCPELDVVIAGPDYRCNEMDWLTDEPFQPWVGDGRDGAARSPDVGLRVQNGAYAAFGGVGSRAGRNGSRSPRTGVWIVRSSTDARCAGARPCLAPTVHWEVIAFGSPCYPTEGGEACIVRSTGGSLIQP